MHHDLSLHPQHYSAIAEDPLNILRDVKIPKFPFVVVYEITGNNIIVYAVHNTWKDPQKKNRRK
jgi:hypothetical protein